MTVTIGGVDISDYVENDGLTWTPRNSIRSVAALDQHVYAKNIATKWDLAISLRNMTLPELQAVSNVVAGQNYVEITTDADPMYTGSVTRTFYDVTITAPVSYQLNGITYLDAPAVSAKEA